MATNRSVQSDAAGETVKFPGIQALCTVHDVYRAMVDDNKPDITKAAEFKGINPVVALRHIKAFEDAINRSGGNTVRVFERSQGKPTVAIQETRVQQLMQEVAEAVAAYRRISGGLRRPLTISVACGLSIGRCILPGLMSRVNADSAEFSFSFKHARPVMLRQLADRGSFDFVLLAVGDDVATSDAGIDCYEFPTALITPRQHWSEFEPFSWKKMRNNKDVMIQLAEDDLQRGPAPRYPSDVLERLRIPIHRVTSTSLSFALVMHGRNQQYTPVTIACPHLFRGSDRDRIHAVFDDRLSNMRFALIRKDQLKRFSDTHITAEKKSLLGEAHAAIKQELDDMLNRPWPKTKRMHLYRVAQAERPVWLHQVLFCRVDRESISGFIKSEHPRTQHGKAESRLQGRLVERGLASHLVAMILPTTTNSHEILASLTCSRQHVDLPFVGFWSQLAPGQPNGTHSSVIGPVTISDSPILNVRELYELSKEFVLPEARADCADEIVDV